jgi:beta-glucanase (GH16 family)
MVMPYATSAPFVLTPDYRVVLNENFTTSNLDMNRWWTRYIYANGTLDYLNDEWERYRESGNHVMENGKLSLMSLPHNGEFWPSGVIRSKDKFNIGNGDSWFIEGRIKSPPGLGIWPGFWIAGVETVPGLDSSCLWPPEIDIMEIVNNGQDDLLNMLHCSGKVLQWDDMGGPQRYTWTQTCDDFNGEWSYWWSPYDFSQDYHSFALLYERPNFTIMCDRKLVLAGTYDWVDDSGAVVPGCHVLCNLAIGGSWAGRYGVDNNAFPQSLDVEYIHVYQRVNQSTIGQDLLPR